MRAIDIKGQRFGRLVALERTDRKKRQQRLWRCICDCGETVYHPAGRLRFGHVKSCGCLRNDLNRERSITHGGSNTRAYSSWCHMMARCYRTHNDRWERYGKRGITVCDRWHSFENFLADMGERPEGLSIDRIDNNGNYEPGNCRWATASEQNFNKEPYPASAYDRLRGPDGRFVAGKASV